MPHLGQSSENLTNCNCFRSWYHSFVQTIPKVCQFRWGWGTVPPNFTPIFSWNEATNCEFRNQKCEKNYLFQMKYVGLLLWAQVLEVDIFMHGWMEESIWKERVYEIWADIYVDCRIWVAWNMGAWIDGWKDRLMNEPNEDQPPPLSSWPGVHIFGHTKAAPRLWDSRFRSISFLIQISSPIIARYFQISSYFVLLI